MFEKAARLKLRFDSPKGNLTVEDLWDLPLTSTRNGANLNDLAKGLNRELKAVAEEDFVTETPKTDSVLQLKLDIVKHVINVRMALRAEANQAAERREKKQRIMDLIAKKQNEQLEGKSLDELQAMMAEL